MHISRCEGLKFNPLQQWHLYSHKYAGIHYLFEAADYIYVFFNFEWHSLNKVNNIGILVLRRDRELPDLPWNLCQYS